MDGEPNKTTIRDYAPEDAAFVTAAVSGMMWELLDSDRREDTNPGQVFELVRVQVESLCARADVATIIAASHENAPIGCLLMGEFSHPFTGACEGFIYYIFVAPEHRGAGVGRKLMTAAETIASRKGYVHVNLETFTLNRKARLLAASLGYEEEYLGYRKRM
ncbi:MAG: GNAT family N-acetyltransferase [Chloroflexi bacterium]|nr:GNAT family N-acetyltransferase [Chloroflexota bacterium]